MELGTEGVKSDGVALRMPREIFQEDALRDRFSDALRDLVQPPRLAGIGADNLLGVLLVRHPDLSVAELSGSKRSYSSELSLGATAVARFPGREDLPKNERASREKAVGVGGGVAASTRSQMSASAQSESPARMNVSEFKIGAQQRAEMRAGASMPVLAMPGSITSDASPVVRGAAVDYRQQIANTSKDMLLRIVTVNGSTMDMQSQLHREFESASDFRAAVEERRAEWVNALAQRDSTPWRAQPEKLADAWQRLDSFLDQAASAQGPDTAFNIAHRLRPDAAKAYDALRALSAVAERDGRPEDAEALTSQASALLEKESSWTAFFLQVRSKTKDESSQSLTLGVTQAKAAGESTRLHEFVPLGAERVGRSPLMPLSAPIDHSSRWDAPVPLVSSSDSTPRTAYENASSSSLSTYYETGASMAGSSPEKTPPMSPGHEPKP